MKAFRLACAAILFLAACSATGRAGSITQIVSFGDSLSDVGNSYAQYSYPASPPYAAGRYSNGPIWLDRLASALGVAAPVASLNGGLDYAVGGAATATPAGFPVPGYAPLITPALTVIGPVPNVNTQISAYLLANHTANAGALYTLWAGANDFLDGQTNPQAPADNLKADILTLISKGAKNFLVANLPSLGLTPLGRAEGPAVQAGLNALTAGFNAELNTDLNAIQAAHPEVQLHRLDAFSLFQSVEANPSAFGLTDVTDPAVLAPAGTNLNQFLFWDDVHPTAAAGVIVGDAAYRATAAPEPPTVALLLIGCAGFLGCGRLLRRKWRLRTLGALGGLPIAALFCALAPCRADSSSPPPAAATESVPSADADRAAETDAVSPTAVDAAVAPVEPLFRHFKLDATALSGGIRYGNGLTIDDLEGNATLAVPLGGELAPLLLTPGAGAHFWKGPTRDVGNSLQPLPPPGAAFGPVSLTTTPDLPRDLYDAYLEIGWQPKLAEWLYADLAVTPGVYSDFKELDYRSFQMRGRGLAIVAFSPQCQVVFGALYVNYNQTKILPAGGLIWNPNDDIKLQMLFPQPKLSRRLGEWAHAQWWGYLAGEFGGGRWSAERADGAIESIDYTDARALLGVEWIVPKGLGGRLEVGYVFDRRVTSTAGVPDYTPDPTVLLRAGVRY